MWAIAELRGPLVVADHERADCRGELFPSQIEATGHAILGPGARHGAIG